MNLVKIKDKYQITLPEKIREKLHCEVGELLSVTLHKTEIVLKPVTIEEKYSEEDIDALERLFKHPRNRGRVMSADEFKKRQEKL